MERSLNRKDFENDWIVERKLIEELTKEFLLSYEKHQSERLLSQPEWKIDSLIRDFSNSENSIEEKKGMNQKVEWLIQNDNNPFIKYARGLLQNINTNEEIKNTISAMTNGRFLDSIGAPSYSGKYPAIKIISEYVDKIAAIKI